MSGTTWIILGASSAMARAFAREAARRHHGLILCGRDTEDLGRIASDARIRGASEVTCVSLDIQKPAHRARVVEAASEVVGVISVAAFIGSMPSQEALDADPDRIESLISDTLSGQMVLIQQLLPRIEAEPGAAVLGAGSVAGDRGRLGNYVYGAAKAGFHTYLAGLRNRMRRAGGHVVTLKPGFVDTAMTWGLPGLFLVATPELVAKDCWRAIERKRDVIYSPWFWRWIMLIIRMIPERIFKRLSI